MTGDKDWANKLKGKAYADSKRQESSIDVGDQVLVRAPKLNKLSSNFDPVIAKNGGQLTIERDGASLQWRTQKIFMGGGLGKDRMVVICIGLALLVTSQFDVISTFPNQRFGEVC